MLKVMYWIMVCYMTILCPFGVMVYSFAYANPNKAGMVLILLMWLLSIVGYWTTKQFLPSKEY